MNTRLSRRSPPAGNVTQAAADDGGPLINGRPALTIPEVQSWFRSVHLSRLDEEAATKVTQQLNYAAFVRFMWAPEFAEQRKANPSSQRMARIAGALATLRDDLPAILLDSRIPNPDNDLSLTEGLLDLVRKHQPIIDMHKTTRGRPNDRAGNLAANIGKLVVELAGPNHVTKKAVDGFVAKAMSWLSQGNAPDAAISRNRRRRASRLKP
jgi:hypothetical protein